MGQTTHQVRIGNAMNVAPAVNTPQNNRQQLEKDQKAKMFVNQQEYDQVQVC
jgi:hypothetical protein